MKFFKKAIIFAVIFIVAGFAYWYFEVKKTKEKEEEKELSSLLFEPSEKKIAKIILKEKNSPEIVIEKKLQEVSSGAEEEGGGLEEEQDQEELAVEWAIKSPVETGAEKMAVDSVITVLKDSKQEEVVWDNLEKLNEYNLDDPEYAVYFSYEGDDVERGIEFGIESLDKKKVFAKVLGKEKIFSVPVSLRENLKKGLFDLRDKRIAPYEGDDIVGISYLSGIDSFILEKEGEDWYFLPDKLKASNARVDMLSGEIRWGSFVQVEEEKGSNYTKYGLDRPRLVINFNFKDDSNYLFMVGDTIEENDAVFFYATRSSDAMIFQVNSDLVGRLIKTKFDLKDRRIFEIETETVAGATLKKGDRVFSFMKEDDDWKFSETGEELERGYKIDNIIRGILTAEYEEREPMKKGDGGYDSTGISDPVYAATLTFNDDRPPLTVKLTERGEATNKLWMTPDDGQTVYYTSGYFISNFPATKEELLE
jgi:hypothetical protein